MFILSICFCTILYILPKEVFAQKIAINFIEINGNKKTKDWVIMRDLYFKVGDSIETSKIADIALYNTNQLLNLQLFNSVKINFMNDSCFIYLEEKWYIWPIPIIEIADRNFNQWWLTKDLGRLIYGIQFEKNNCRGRNENLLLFATLGYTRVLDLRYTIPALKNYTNIGIFSSLQLQSNNETWYKTMNNQVQFYDEPNSWSIKRNKFLFSVVKRKGNQQYQNVSLFVNRFKVADTILSPSLNPYILGDEKKVLNLAGIGYNFVLDHRDIREQPLHGNYFNIGFIMSYLSTGFKSNFIPQFNYRSSHFMQLANKFYASTGLHLKSSLPNRQAYVLNRALGYEYNLMRGYDFYVVEGNHSAILKNNLKYGLLVNRKINLPFMPFENYKVANNTLFLTIFSDLGYVRNQYVSADNTFANTLLYSYGIGLEWNIWYTYLVRLELAQIHTGRSGIFLNFKMSI